MSLFLFYIEQIFRAFHLPMPGEICSGADSIMPMCKTAISFTLLYSAIIITALAVMAFKTNRLQYAKIMLAGILSFVSCFYFADRALKQLEDPLRFGIEWFVVSYHFWCFVIFNSFISSVIFFEKRKKIYLYVLLFTILNIFIFAYFGRGNFEQITPLLGGLLAKRSWNFLLLSFNFRLFCALCAVALFFSLFAIVIRWLIDGVTSLKYFRYNFAGLAVFFLIFMLTGLSVPMGDALNKKDVREAKIYIEALKKKADKYYRENGEYPKILDAYLPKGDSPRLLKRHEFFTAGVKGTYYFSRKEKYCFVFQNPTKKFGYYSLTSERDWRFTSIAGSYDDVFLSMCDESMKNYEDLISGHLGVDPDDEMVNEITAETNQKLQTPVSARASQILEQRILEESKKDPSLLKQTPIRPVDHNESKQ